ncbi:condensation domain-containing protein [Nostoc sp. NMS8]|uniref:condensation domain-containing protein n=1 Tax=Nostoc sp. NMS8 TaxID=2815392 RepID=UPI0025E6AD71|nr:condensation domain-containing protein [Nostoc sp. NMS8]MBN3958480.1 non-ribosomal peptide synthetase [Nostoc sp. NMS8]
MRENIQDIYPLSPIQHGMLFHCLHAPEMELYHSQSVYTFSGNLNIDAFKYAWQQVATRHTILRTSFYWEELDKPLQVVHQQVEVPVDYQDWQELDPLEQQEHLQSFLESDRLRRFDFSQAPLMRLAIIQIQEHTYYLVWSSNLLILDGWSYLLVLNDVIEIYEAYCQGQDAPLRNGSCFKDYIKWLKQQDLSKAEEFWRQQLNGVKEPTPLTNLYPNNLSNLEERYEDIQISLSEAITRNLDSLARQHHLTMNTIVQGVWAILLSHYSGKNDVIYGCTTSGRPVDLEGSESMVGEMVNTLPVHAKIDLDEHLLSWLQQLQTQLIELREYEYYPLVDIQKCSKVLGNVPLFESFVVFENQKTGNFLQEWGSLNISEQTSYYKTNYPLNIVGYPGSELTIGINYDFRRFDAATIMNILHHLKILLEGIVTNPQVRLKELLLLTEQAPHIKILILDKEMSLHLDFALTN